LIAAHKRLWGDAVGDDAAAVSSAERRLGIALPRVLGVAYRETSLRHSAMLHLRNLDELTIEDCILIFADEQQQCWSWGIAVTRLSEDDPPLLANPFVADPSVGAELRAKQRPVWKDDGCTLTDFLRFFSLTNRPFEEPYLQQCNYDASRLEGSDWQRHVV